MSELGTRLSGILAKWSRIPCKIIVALARSQRVAPSDPSPLRWYLTGQFLVFRRKALVSRPGWSPAFEVVQRGPTGYNCVHEP
jgi:hypothetical protein